MYFPLRFFAKYSIFYTFVFVNVNLIYKFHPEKLLYKNVRFYPQ